MKTSVLESVYTLESVYIALARGTQIADQEWRGWEFRQTDSKWSTNRAMTNWEKTSAPARKSPITNFL